MVRNVYIRADCERLFVFHPHYCLKMILVSPIKTMIAFVLTIYLIDWLQNKIGVFAYNYIL